jgi:prepilin-type processing-associated H-X9-DG protein
MMGNNEGLGGVHTTPEYTRFASTVDPGPAAASLFIEEQASTTPDNTSLDDGYFALDETGFGPAWRNIPGSRHGDFGHFSFADGHAGNMRWLMSTTQNIIVNSTGGDTYAATVYLDKDLEQVWKSIYPWELWNK